MREVILFIIMVGGISFLMGLLGGATGLLSDSTPYWLAGGGVFLMYLGVCLTFAIGLYRMDE